MDNKRYIKALFFFMSAILQLVTKGCSRSQDDYYWGNYTKITLQKDFTLMSVFFNPEHAHLNNEFLYREVENIKELDIYRNGEMTIISFHEPVHEEVIFNELYGDNPEWILGYCHGYRDMSNKNYWLTPKITLKLKSGYTLNDIYDLLNEYDLLFVRESYGQLILQSKHVNKMLEAANKIHEHPLVDWCHPDFHVKFGTENHDPL